MSESGLLDRRADSLEMLQNAYRLICEHVERRKRSHNSRLTRSINEYIDSSYSNPGLCIATVADRFGLSETYVSHFFKEQNGVSFHYYLEDLRMRKAEELLATPQVSIKDIAQKTGFGSQNTFCRVFKRRFGITATEYREATPGAGI